MTDDEPHSPRFVWDPRKDCANLQKHGLSFADVAPVFVAGLFVDIDDAEDYGEERWIGMGLLGQHVVVIVFTEPDLQTIRIISARRAERHEQARFFEQLQDGLGQG